MRIICFSIIVFLSVLPLHAKMTTAVLKLCFEKDGVPFLISTADKELAEKEGFQKHPQSDRYVRKMKLTVDYQPYFSFKPLNDNCLNVLKLTEGQHIVAADFKGASYTTLQATNNVTQKYKADLLYEGKIKVSDGPSAELQISQEQNKIQAFQTIDNQPIPNCEKDCLIPAEIPIYFMIKAEDEKIECPVQYELIHPDVRDKQLSCYNEALIREQLKQFVKTSNIKCKVNVEFAFFKVYGEGCLITLEPDASGLRAKDPEIRLLPLDKQKVKYFIKVGEAEKKTYQFAADRKGEIITPQSGETILFEETRN